MTRGLHCPTGLLHHEVTTDCLYLTGVDLFGDPRSVLEAPCLRHRLQVVSILLMSGIPLPPDHHPRLLEGVIPQPQLPDDASVVAVALGIGEILTVQV